MGLTFGDLLLYQPKEKFLVMMFGFTISQERLTQNLGMLFNCTEIKLYKLQNLVGALSPYPKTLKTTCSFNSYLHSEPKKSN